MSGSDQSPGPPALCTPSFIILRELFGTSVSFPGSACCLCEEATNLLVFHAALAETLLTGDRKDVRDVPD